MKKNIKYIFVILISTILTSSSIIGCSNIKSMVKVTTETTETTKIPKLLWWQVGNEPQDNELVVSEMNKYSKEKIGIEAQIKYIETTDWANKVAVIILGGEKFDLMFTDYTYYNLPVELGGFADITDVLETSAPELKKFIPDILWDGVKVDGRIYSVPTYKDSAQTKYWVWDSEFMSENGLEYENVSTYEDLDPLVRKMKQLRPNDYPIYIDKKGLESVIFGYDAIDGFPLVGVYYTDKATRVVNILEQPEVIERITYLNSWYKDGIINPDVMSISSIPKRRLVRESTGYEGANIVWSSKYGYTTASTKTWGPLYSTTSIRGSLNVISSNSNYIEESVKYLELINLDSTFRNMFAYGIENKHYKKTGDGTVEYLNELYIPSVYSQATYFTMMPVSPNPSNAWDLVKKQNEEATVSPMLGFSFDSSNVKKEFKDCVNIYNEYKSELFTGINEPSTILKKVNDELYKAGIQEIINEAQKQINAFTRR